MLGSRPPTLALRADAAVQPVASSVRQSATAGEVIDAYGLTFARRVSLERRSHRLPVAIGRELCRDGLMARFGADAALPDVLMALATCERRQDFFSA
jgi:hypothetical protein